MAISRRQFQELLKRLEKPVRKAFFDAINEARSFAKINALMTAIESGDEAAIYAAAGIREGTFSGFSESLRNAYLEGGKAASSALPASLALQFDINNPRAENFLRTKSATEIVGNLKIEQRKAIQTVLSQGMIRGDNPRTVALDIVGRIGTSGRRSGGVLGLTSNQAEYVRNMADDLEALDWQKYKSRKLRDRRFDSVVRRHANSGKPIPKKTRDKIVARYSDRWLKHRGDTIARTETLRAINESADEVMRQIVDEGLAPKQAVVKVWEHSFGKDERPGHAALNGVQKELDELFVNPVTGVPLKYPGDGPAGEVINCRCRIAHRVDFSIVNMEKVA